MKLVALSVSTLAMLGLASAIAAPAAGLARSDCPGKVICPLTGEKVCRDQCPLTNVTRSDCPGQITCPIDGEIVCRDQCPLATADEAGDDATAALPQRRCCQNR